MTPISLRTVSATHRLSLGTASTSKRSSRNCFAVIPSYLKFSGVMFWNQAVRTTGLKHEVLRAESPSWQVPWFSCGDTHAIKLTSRNLRPPGRSSRSHRRTAPPASFFVRSADSAAVLLQARQERPARRRACIGTAIVREGKRRVESCTSNLIGQPDSSNWRVPLSNGEAGETSWRAKSWFTRNSARESRPSVRQQHSIDVVALAIIHAEFCTPFHESHAPRSMLV